MSDIEFRVAAWQKHQSAIEQELARVNFLNKPLPKMNSPELYKPVKVKVLRGFYVDGVARQPGEVVLIPLVLAKNMVASSKAEWCNE